MAIGDLNDGSRFGLPPIGLPQSNLGTQGSDTERRAFPGLATKSSVFAWRSDTPPVHFQASVAAGFTTVIDLRKNTSGGSAVSVDVPSWAAGAIVFWYTMIATMGAGVTKHLFGVTCPVTPLGTNIFTRTHDTLALVQCDQFIIPFFDEPVFTIGESNDASNTNGTVNSFMNLLGFVRNV